MPGCAHVFGGAFLVKLDGPIVKNSVPWVLFWLFFWLLNGHAFNETTSEHKLNVHYSGLATESRYHCQKFIGSDRTILEH